MTHSEAALLRLLPRVLRARDFHLYLEGGKRLTDLWRWGGRAVLGHKPPKVLVELKNAAERGLFTPLPHPMEGRFIKALREFFPGRVFRLYMDEGSLRRALAEAGFDGPPSDPAFPPQDSARTARLGVSLWRPFLQTPQPDAILVPVLPWPQGPAVLVLEKSMEDTFAPGELIPPALLAPAARALHNLAAALKACGPPCREQAYPKIRKALSGSQPTPALWRRQGIYITAGPDTSGETYEALFRRFLDGGFLIPPSGKEPVILPLSMTSGEESKLAQLMSHVPDAS
ncbi:MAG: hypothetical protein FWC64_10585 [Treponema sp.]|nr:hypothetical protein [Treponema sp.]